MAITMFDCIVWSQYGMPWRMCLTIVTCNACLGNASDNYIFKGKPWQNLRLITINVSV